MNTDLRILLEGSALDAVIQDMAEDLLSLTWPSGDEGGKVAVPWLLGIQSGGLPVAWAMADAIERKGLGRPKVGALDISLYRDDTWLKGPKMSEGQTELPGDPTGQRVVLVDDVLSTGRTVRAALNVLVDFGRPEAVHLAVLVDRGGRELPIAAAITGQVVHVASDRDVRVVVDDRGRPVQVVAQRTP